jgi:class 3 adenylate cyclase
MSTAERRLSAIMFTDIVGYSTITQINEETALRLLQEHRAILRPIFIKYNGNEIKTIGDAFLVEFQSALLAVKCAIEIQRELKTRNSFLDTKEHIWLRIGLHIGDVVFQHNDVYGDGVNIASRIHAQAPPGGICISRAVYEQIANKIDEKVIKQRSQKLKSIEKPVQLFLIELDKKQPSRRAIPYLIAGVIGVCVILGLSFLVYQSSLNSDTAAVTEKDASNKVDTLKNLKPTIVDSTLTTDQINNEPINEPITNTQPSIPSITTNEPRVKPEASFTGDANWRGLVDRYQPITVAGSWNELQRKLTIYRDSGLFGVYASETAVPVKNGSLVAIIDANATSSTSIEAYLIYTDSGFKNVASEEKITNLNTRYPGRRQIWIRSLK